MEDQETRPKSWCVRAWNWLNDNQGGLSFLIGGAGIVLGIIAVIWNASTATKQAKLSERQLALSQQSERASLLCVTPFPQPFANGEMTSLVLLNEGREDAVVSGVSFEPTQSFNFTPTVSMFDTIPARRVIFRTNNRRSDGIFEKRLQEPFRVPGDQSVRIEIALVDLSVVDSVGRRGKVIVQYNYTEPLIIEDVTLHVLDREPPVD